MSQKKTLFARLARQYRAAAVRSIPVPMRHPNGAWRRGEGHHNVPYGPLKRHAYKSSTISRRSRYTPATEDRKHRG